MLEFKDCLSEWKNMPSLLHVEESASAAGICAFLAFVTRFLT